MVGLLGSKKSRLPPPLELSDGGLRWRREGGKLTIDRRGSPRAILFPTLGLIIAGTIATLSFRSGDFIMGSIMGLSALFAAVMVWVRIVHRAEIVIGSAGVQWKQVRPRASHGHWSRDQVDGLRVYVHAKGRWLRPRQGHVELRVDGSWVMLVFSGPLRRAERMAEAIAMTTGLSPDRAETES